MYYNPIESSGHEPLKDPAIAESLIRLRAGLDRQIPDRTISRTLLIGTWNLREFDSYSYGLRKHEAMLCIAEIISRFDIVALQEIRDNLKPLEKLREYLGPWWKYTFTDVTEGKRGNGERMAFLYDSRKMVFGGLSGELVLPDKDSSNPRRQLARTPFIVGFKAGWFRFMLTTVHILYGGNVANLAAREQEIREVAEFMRDRAKDKYAFAPNVIMLGDFNIFNPDDVTYKAITDAGFVIPERLQRIPSNVAQNKYYDQIAFYSPALTDQLMTCRGGVFNFFNYVYRDEDEARFAEDMGKSYLFYRSGDPRDEAARRRFYRSWRTHQLSDHLPMWVEINIDWSDQFLADVAAGN